MTVHIQRDAASVADCLAAPVFVGNGDGEVLGALGRRVTGCAQQVLTGTLEVKVVPIQGGIMGVTPGLALSCADWLAAILAGRQQSALLARPTAGRRADQ